jgi:DNA gyrase subunit B
MKEIIERGYLYIAQPPLFKISDRKQELYIHNEETMKDYILDSGVNRVRLQVVNGSNQTITGSRLLGLIKKAMRIETILDRFEREEKNREIVRILAGDPALSEEDFRTQEALTRVVNLIAKALGDRLEGSCTEMDQIQTTSIDRDILKLPKFQEIKALLSQVAVLGDAPYRVGSEEGDGGTKEKVLESVDSLSALIDYVVTAGKRGFAIQRYKGLGEMNPEQLWETTMNPEKRTLLQVRIEDAVAADEIFTTLMGDQVEPRRDFIYKNALYASNLDV